ncbi:carbohydrate binding domain-containing protein [Cerasicoccus maritimus]|uniref:carbohydrate binding domain-containing protein n=1 Tax=Cerasicoccus maritimus TaxID=490089 RepID=UPI002852A093|nr:carbohydrate binding domain-containing protein [Cerasicoccus maritimus]
MFISKLTLSLIAAFSLALTLSAETNLLQNPGFEDGMSFWTEKDDGLSKISKEAAYAGKNGIRVTDNTKDTGSSLYSQEFPAKQGDEFYVSFWASIVDGPRESVGVYIQYLDDYGTLLTTRETGLTFVAVVKGTIGSWEQYDLSAIAPENTAFVRLWVHSWNAVEVVADFDEFEFYQK